VLLALYLANLLINTSEDKFVTSMEVLFGYKPSGEVEQVVFLPVRSTAT
jgi:hypothetical protein